MCSAIVTKQNCNFLVPILNLIYRSHGTDGSNGNGRGNGPHGTDGSNGSHGTDWSGRHGRCNRPHGTDGSDGYGGNFGASFRLFDAVGARYGMESSAFRCERRIVGYGYHSYGGQR